MSKYDYFIAGRYINHKSLDEALKKIRGAGRSAYCCIENEYDGHGIKQERVISENRVLTDNISHIKDWKTNPAFRKMFKKDMAGLKNSGSLVLIFPAGLSSHMELGVAYGLEKKCYGIGNPEKTETLYLMFDKTFSSIDKFIESIK